MADRDITVDVTIRSDGKGGKAGAKALGDVDKAAAGAGKSMKKMEVDSKALESQISKSKTTIKELETELTKVGNNPGIRKSLRVERSWLSELEKIAKDIPKVMPPIELPSPKLDLGGLQSALMPALIGVAAAASPAIGAVIGGAVVGAVGLGGIAGGIVAAAGDNRVKAAWKDFTGSLSGDDFGRQAFVNPVIEGIGILKAGLKDLNLGEALSKGADAVPTLAKGVTNFAQNVMPGFNAVMNRSGEISDIVATGLGDVGGALGSLIFDIAQSKGSMDGLRYIFVETSALIKGTGSAVASLGDAFDSSLNFIIPLGQGMADFYGFLSPVHDALQSNVDAFKEVDGQGKNVTFTLSGISGATQALNNDLNPLDAYLKDAAKNFDDLNGSMKDYLSQNLNADQATLAFKEDILGLKEAVKQHGHSLSDNTKEGLDNQKMIQGLIGDAQRVRDATYAQTGSVQAADAAYKNQIDTLKDVLRHLHFTEDQIKAMVGDYNINVITTFTTVGSAAKPTQLNKAEDRFDKHRAAGGGVQANMPYVINERGYETVTFPAGGTVHPAHLTPMMPNAPSGGGSVRPLVVAGDGLSDMFFTWLRNAVGAQGGTLAVLGIRN